MDKSLIIRIIVLVFSLVNTAITMMGLNPISVSDSVIYELVSIAVTLAAVVWNAYKNNNFTPASRLAQKVLDGVRKGEITADRVEELFK